jgi:hypothetical protein
MQQNFTANLGHLHLPAMVSTYSFNNKLYMKRTDGGKDHKVEFS